LEAETRSGSASPNETAKRARTERSETRSPSELQLARAEWLAERAQETTARGGSERNEPPPWRRRLRSAPG